MSHGKTLLFSHSGQMLAPALQSKLNISHIDATNMGHLLI